MQIKEQDLPLITHKSTLLHTTITNKGNVMPKYLNYYQDTFLDKYPNDKFTPHRQAIFHIDSGANVHATNTRTDFLVFHPIQSVINLAVGSKAICKGFGAMLIQLASTDPPILFAPVYYCPTAKVSTLSPGAIKIYNGYKDMNLRLLKELEYRKTLDSESHTLPTTVYNNMDYLALPIIHLKHAKNDIQHILTINTLTHQHANNQFIHNKS